MEVFYSNVNLRPESSRNHFGHRFPYFHTRNFLEWTRNYSVLMTTKATYIYSYVYIYIYLYSFRLLHSAVGKHLIYSFTLFYISDTNIVFPNCSGN